MRTTIEIPDELFKRAKQAALSRGTTLKDVVIRALRREVEPTPVVRDRRVQFPIVRSDRPGSVRIGAEDIDALEVDDDAGRRGD